VKSLIILFSLILNSYAQTSIEECATLAQYYGHATLSQEVPVECYGTIKELSASMQKVDGYTIAGHKNLLYIELDGILKLTSGNKTLLKEIIAIDAAPSEDLVFVLSKGQTSFEVLSFPISFAGNLAPRRRLVTEELEGATGLRSNPSKKELYVFSRENSWIKVFNQNADPNGKRAENSNAVKRSIIDVSPIDLAITGEELYILTDTEIMVFEREANGVATPLRVKNVSEFGLVKNIKFDSKQSLQLINEAGESYTISEF